ncbi:MULTISPECIES: STAS domain-containing protein [unclassified Coleofasciculus]|uniref:STAS domain-containing protein n=1 Tax=unclassified Coleofasciculus TaxID=2692782 RepID=UPI0018817FDE|nr:MULTISPECIES: STAS domain-containing protein [unclassified Coleofasciculus]MBE9125867.1 STAS domain-containing protein [Coleofasciculus sp. LEGE 07081]MBE9149057.1 STAS domain-containing protein [Coleofasciculus sp. LEGE 07092]
MAITIWDSQVAIVQPDSSVNADNIVDFQNQLTTVILSERHSALLVDMSWVESIDRPGLIALVAAFRLAQRRGKRFGLCRVTPSLRIIFELTQLDRAFEIFENRTSFTDAIAQKQEEVQNQKEVLLIA